MNKLITALRLAANALDNGSFDYDWSQAESCNCGVLACFITGYSQRMLEKHLPEGLPKSETNLGGSWTVRVSRNCPVTGTPVDEILKALFEAGMTREDFHHLEFCNNREVLDRMGIDFRDRLWVAPREKTLIDRILRREPAGHWKYVSFQNKSHVAMYMRSWA